LEITGLQGDCKYNPSVNDSPKIYLASPDKERFKITLSAIADWVKEAGNFQNAPRYEPSRSADSSGNYRTLVDLEHITDYALQPASYTKITDPWARFEEILQEKLSHLDPVLSEENFLAIQGNQHLQK
jgi:hypothetical protein